MTAASHSNMQMRDSIRAALLRPMPPLPFLDRLVAEQRAYDSRGVQTVSATLHPPTAPNALERSPERKVAFRLTAADAEKLGLGDRFRATIARRLQKRDAWLQATAEMQALTGGMCSEAEALEISHTKMLIWAELAWGSWRRCVTAQANPVVWLPIIRAAAEKFRQRAKEEARIKEAAKT